MGDTKPANIDALVDEVLALRVENQRLRSLLGLDEPSRHEATEPWEPTLFAESDRQELKGDVNATRQLRPRSPCSGSCSLAARMCTPFAGRAREPERPAGAPPSWVAGRTRRSQDARICHLTKEWWSHTSLVRVTSVSILCATATNVDSWPVISTEEVGCLMHWLTSTLPLQTEFLSRSSDHVRGKGRTPGHSFPDPSRLLPLDAWEYTSSARQWSSEPSSICRVTTACSTQDFVPKGSFGNLIALPLQGECRRQGNTVFLDPSSLEPYEDQWAFLASIPRMSPEAVEAMEKTLAPVAAGPDDTRYRRPRAGGAHQKPPEVIRAVSGAMLAIDRIGVPRGSWPHSNIWLPCTIRSTTKKSGSASPRGTRPASNVATERPSISSWFHADLRNRPLAWWEMPEAVSKLPTRARCPSQSMSHCRPVSQTVSGVHWMRLFRIISACSWRLQVRVRP